MKAMDLLSKGTHLIILWLSMNIAVFQTSVDAAPAGGSMLGDVNISAILDSFSVSYDKRVRPNYGGPPVEVGVTMYVLSISSVSEVMMDFTLDFYFRQFWTDPRLAYRKRPGVEMLSVGSDFIKNIWVPDKRETIILPHCDDKLTITASCPMNLEYFPMDRQLCQIEIESFGDIRYFWRDGLSSVGMSNEVELPQFRVLGHRQRATEINLTTVGYTMRDIRYKWNERPNSVGVSSEVSLPQFKVLGHRQRAMEISLTTEYATVGYMAKRIQMRKQRFMAIQKIAQEKKLQVDGGQPPSAMMSAGPDHSHSHSSHGHSHSHQHGPKQSVQQTLPGNRPSGFSNMQQNVGSRGCSLVGPLFQEVRFKVHDPKAHSKGTLENTINGGRGRSNADSGPDEESGGDMRPPPPPHLIHPGKDINKLLGITPSDIDKYSRIVFPVCFVCFNLMYWIIYLHVSDVVADDLFLLKEDK